MRYRIFRVARVCQRQLRLLSVALSGALMYLNEATLLHNIRMRYQRDVIYVWCFLYCSSTSLFCIGLYCLL